MSGQPSGCNWAFEGMAVRQRRTLSDLDRPARKTIMAGNQGLNSGRWMHQKKHISMPARPRGTPNLTVLAVLTKDQGVDAVWKAS